MNPVVIAANFIILAPVRYLKMMCKVVNDNRKIKGRMAGKILILSSRFPCKRARNDRVIPHPGHSIPRYFFHWQVIERREWCVLSSE